MRNTIDSLNGASCSPNCPGVQCGDDGCGGECAPGCGEGDICDDDGQCGPVVWEEAYPNKRCQEYTKIGVGINQLDCQPYCVDAADGCCGIMYSLSYSDCYVCELNTCISDLPASKRF
eukprot:TRINITY_DN4900_c0_g1_i2.p1 TRINITY_DN4900_c0_g1~~TRINITY_DN4900_c0_g1_i2.p1  ORF type:complete len:118 (-),score=16.30 TRINITY_DN4900_c0_g1_i2:91-444(-)